MTFPRATSILLSPLILACVASAQSVSIDFTGLGSSEVAEDGPTNQLSFVPDSATGYDFQISSSSLPGLVGDLGVIDGKYNIATVNTISVGPTLLQEATLTGAATLLISDGSADRLSATITWNSVTIDGMDGTFNSVGVTTLSNLVYTGTDAALLQLSEQTSVMGSAMFHLLPRNSEFNLALGDWADASSISGSFVAIPEPAQTGAVLGCLVLLAVAAARRLRGKAILSPAPCH